MATKEKSKGVRFIIKGRVQGVGFRWSTVTQAGSLGLTGRVFNGEDGRVEVEAYGNAGVVNQLSEWLNHGPAFAQVESVTSEAITGIAPDNFKIG
ncbi:MAG: acylphosphatase [Acidiferrobacteraceae bacterium]|jgi:acylphosphatase|nr:acylphosphatase [Acidiferrobacteraceae bacterium]MDP6122567.1 acylphosphatase [Arenicellales bacterium]MBT59495.1 acylphosphatase [Acidiferrobacteraceae bacterium]MDP6435222.1 acylphosphatase [Arenicellales bacterium]MDP6671580.1 acylphosphatase [Arenicellales bacterium]|tara:strand:+ start:1773 stop:2057 length:285 start_codon:yes stop_codon:yes gene_type:complete